MKSFIETYSELLSHDPDDVVTRFTVPINAGILFPMALFKRYCIMNDLDYSLEKLGGIVFRDYVLIVRNIKVADALELMDYFGKLERQ